MAPKLSQEEVFMEMAATEMSCSSDTDSDPSIKEMETKSRRKGDRLRKFIKKIIGKEEEQKEEPIRKKQKKVKPPNDDPGFGMGV